MTMRTTVTGVARAVHPSPLGPLTLVASDEGLRAVMFPEERTGRAPVPAARSEVPPEKGTRRGDVLAEAACQLDEYFAGERRDFTVDLDPVGTDFQLRAWLALRTIPYGETRSYAQQAAIVGSPSAVRAVGAANGRNPIAIIVPCHRVIGADGSLTGYAGGMDAKRFLLALEGHTQPTLFAV